MLSIAYPKTGMLTFFDPLGSPGPNARKWLEMWSYSTSNVFQQQWYLDLNVKHSLQTDPDNCGVYVVEFFKKMIETNDNFISLGKAINYERRKILHSIRTSSETTFCARCGESNDPRRYCNCGISWHDICQPQCPHCSG